MEQSGEPLLRLHLRGSSRQGSLPEGSLARLELGSCAWLVGIQWVDPVKWVVEVELMEKI